MKFSTRAGYGMRAMANLALCYPHVKSAQKISKEERISLKYLERLMNRLKRKELVKSFRGKGGGYQLSKKPQSIAVGEIIEALEGPVAFRNCKSGVCVSKKCVTKKVWLELEKRFKEMLWEIKLSDLVK
jgi:Rrf2 family protein